MPSSMGGDVINMGNTNRSDTRLSFPGEEELDDLRAFRETCLVRWSSVMLPPPQAARQCFAIGNIQETIELLPSKSLDTRPDGLPWICSMDRIVTPTSLEDLGDFQVGSSVDLEAVLRDCEHETFPYHVSAATRSIVLVQHNAGCSPTAAPFMFVGQRQSVKKVIATSWEAAAELVETFPEASDIGPVLVINMTGRCGSTVLSKAMEWLDIGCQSVSEPEVITDIHEMLERGLCTKAQAKRALRTVFLMLVHQRRLYQPDKPMIIIKNRSLSCCWRQCDVLHEAVPGVKQIFQWRNLEDVIGSFEVAVQAAMVSPTLKFLHKHAKDGLMWPLSGSPAVPCMRRMITHMNSDPLLSEFKCDDLDVNCFAAHGSLGYQTLRTIYSAHVSIAMSRQGHWAYILQYEDLMERKSACVADLLRELGWLSYISDPAILGTFAGDQVFQKDAHSGGGLSKAGGSTLGGDVGHLQKAAKAREANSRDNAHLPKWKADIVRDLMAQHKPLAAVGYDLGLGHAPKRQSSEAATSAAALAGGA